MAHFGQKLRMMRVHRGYTQTQIADLLRVNLRTVQSWEAGEKTPSLTGLILEKIASLPRAKEPRAGRPGRKPRRKKSRKPED